MLARSGRRLVEVKVSQWQCSREARRCCRPTTHHLAGHTDRGARYGGHRYRPCSGTAVRPHVHMGGRHGRSSRSCCWAEHKARARASWTIANRCRRVAGAGQPELMPLFEFSEVCRCRCLRQWSTSWRLRSQRIGTSRRVPDIVSPTQDEPLPHRVAAVEPRATRRFGPDTSTIGNIVLLIDHQIGRLGRCDNARAAGRSIA